MVPFAMGKRLRDFRQTYTLTNSNLSKLTWLLLQTNILLFCIIYGQQKVCTANSQRQYAVGFANSLPGEVDKYCWWDMEVLESPQHKPYLAPN